MAGFYRFVENVDGGKVIRFEGGVRLRPVHGAGGIFSKLGGPKTALVPTAALAVAYIGWREGYLILAGILLAVILPLVILLLRSRPGPGQHADGADISGDPNTIDERDLSRHSADPNAGMSLGQACRTGLFWRLSIGFFI